MSIDNIACGCANELTIKLHASGDIDVKDNGPSLEINKVIKLPDGKEETLIELLFRQTHAGCRDEKKSEVLMDVLCKHSVAMVNCLSTHFFFEAVHDGHRWIIEYENGKMTKGLTRLESSVDQFQHLRFKPDYDIFKHKIDPELLAKTYRDTLKDVFPKLPHLTSSKVQLWDEESGKTIDLAQSE